MSLLPLPSRLPERKHVLAIVFGLLGLAFMIGAVLTASGLALPFTSRDPANVRTGSILIDAPTTTAPPADVAAGATTTTGVNQARALDPVGVPGPTTAPPSTAPRGTPTTTSTSTTLPPVPPLILPLGGVSESLMGR